jgi:hypothetical protein
VLRGSDGATGPRRVGPYRIVERLGGGGMGVVYAGVDDAGTRAAVKVIHPALAEDAEFLERFAREVAVLRRVTGPRVAAVLGAETGGGTPWLATEYVPGPTLERRVLDDGPLTGDELYGLAAGLAAALVAIHGAGVVHRDLKPSNVLLSPAGPRVVDFGIARVLDQTSITRTGMLVGSPGWVSPEEYRGDTAGPAADVHGWGALVCFAATGRPPFGQGRPEVLAVRVIGEAPDTSGVPEGLRELAERALSKDPGERPGAEELLELTAARWCGANDEEPTTAAEDVTRLLTRTWPTRVEPGPVWPEEERAADRAADRAVQPAVPPSPGRPPERSPERRRGTVRRVVLTVLAAVAAVAAVAAGLVVLKPWRPSPTEVAQAFLDRITDADALHLSSGDSELTVTADGFMLGEADVGGRQLRMLTVPTGFRSGTFFRASGDFWRYNTNFFQPYVEPWSQAPGLYEVYMADFGDKWLRVPAVLPSNVNPAWYPRLFKAAFEQGADFAGFGWHMPDVEVEEVTVRGREAVRVTRGRAAGRSTYDISRDAPHRILGFAVDGQAYDVTEVTGSAAAAFADELRAAVGELAEGRETNLGFTRTQWGRCDGERCTVKTTVHGSSTLSQVDRAEVVTHLHDGSGHVVETCRKRVTRASLGDSDRPVSCTVGSSAWRFFAASGRRVWATSYVVQRPYTKAQVEDFLARLGDS